MSKIKVSNIEITIIKTRNEDYISLTDMIKAKDGDFFITDWLRNRNTLEFLSVWEQLYNPNYNFSIQSPHDTDKSPLTSPGSISPL